MTCQHCRAEEGESRQESGTTSPTWSITTHLQLQSASMFALFMTQVTTEADMSCATDNFDEAHELGQKAHATVVAT